MNSGIIGRVKVWASLAFVAAVVAGCGQTETGHASSGGDGATTPASSSSAVPESGQVTEPVDPCSLVTQEEMSQYGDFEGPESRTLQGSPVCSWTESAGSVSDDDAPLVDFMFLENRGISDIVDLGDGVSEGVTDTSGRALARTSGINQVTEAPECLISMEIDDASRLDVLVGFTEEPCELAGQLVEMIDTKLPRG